MLACLGRRGGSAAASEVSSSAPVTTPAAEELGMDPEAATDEPSCGSSELSCDRWLELELELGPPPDFLRMVPPPPVPEFMEDYVQRLHQASGECLLCNWAHNNDSLLLVGAGELGGEREGRLDEIRDVGEIRETVI